MTLYSKWFDTHNEYEAYKNGLNYILPNVSICFQDRDIHYQKTIDPYNGYEYVDLGLPSGTLWAKCNVGGNNITDYGLYFQWGDSQGYTQSQVGVNKNFTWNDYKYGSFDSSDEINWGMTKYNAIDGKTTLDLSDDPARIAMGGEWHSPSHTQINELINMNNLYKEFVTIDGINGVRLTSPNGNTLFLPWGGSAYNSQMRGLNSSGLFWTSNIGESVDCAFLIGTNSETFIGWECLGRELGCNVRGVIG